MSSWLGHQHPRSHCVIAPRSYPTPLKFKSSRPQSQGMWVWARERKRMLNKSRQGEQAKAAKQKTKNRVWIRGLGVSRDQRKETKEQREGLLSLEKWRKESVLTEQGSRNKTD